MRLQVNPSPPPGLSSNVGFKRDYEYSIVRQIPKCSPYECGYEYKSMEY